MNEQARKETSLARIAVRALGLLIVIPTLGILYIFKDDLEGKQLPLLFLLILAGLGFYLFLNIVNSITRILKGLEKVSRGEAETVDFVQGPSQLKEMTEIINSLNALTEEFRENALQLERFIEQFATLTELTEITARIPDIRELLELVLKRAMASTRAHQGSIMLLDERGERLEIVAANGWSPESRGPIRLSETICGRVIESGQPLVVEDIDQMPELGHSNRDERYASPSFMIIPLMSKTATIGVVCLSEKSPQQAFSNHDEQFLRVMLGQVGFAVENARLLRQARDAAEQLKEAIHFKDIQLQSAQQQIIQAEKLSALGQLIAGVAHEINNPLTAVSGFSELLLMKDEKDLQGPEVQQGLQTIFKEASRATKIVQNLLSFAREKKPETRMGDLNAICRTVVELRQYDLKTRGIELITQLDAQLPGTMLDADQIQQVVLNLVNNAEQALGSKGHRVIELGTRKNDARIQLWVKDNGCGIPREMVDRIFDPFFTTKMGKTNSGLGLSISYGIIKQHEGEIMVTSEEDKGTTISIDLPVVKDDEKKISESKPATSSKTEVSQLKVFVVDDEPSIVALITSLLKTYGYQVDACSSGKEAIQRLMQEDYDAVICDVRMPDLDGRHLYQEILQKRPLLAERFIFTTGNIADPEIRSFAETNQIRLVAKPFRHKDLLDALSVTGKTDAEVA